MLLTIISFILVVSILVFVHELGHFAVARLLGVGVEEFGFGLPPRVFGKKIKGTLYSVNWLPIGGFVKLTGEDDEGNHPKSKIQNPKSYFWARSKKVRAAILLAGVTMNFLLAVAITTFLLSWGVYEPSGRIHIDGVVAGGPAEIAGIAEKDIVQSITYRAPDGASSTTLITLPKDLIDTTKAHLGEEIVLRVVRDGTPLTLTVIPRKESPQGQGPMGIIISDLELKRYPWHTAPIRGLTLTLERAGQMFQTIGDALYRLVTFQPVGGEIAGPIGIAQVAGQAARYGVIALLEFMSILSLNLAVLNLLPIPALDGGRLVFVFIEKIFGRPVRPAFEKSTHQIGMIILFTLLILISIHDILRLFRG